MTKKRTINQPPPSKALVPLEESTDLMLEMTQTAIQTIIAQKQLATLWEPTPKHAIKQRPGAGGKTYNYVNHGFVEFRLNKAFGGDWDLEPLSAFGGNAFHLQQVEVPTGRGNTTETHYSVAVLARLTVRVRDPKTLTVVATIVKEEFGSAEWYPSNEFGDALKSALSDALKRCGLRLGIALDLYYDDERAQAQQESMDAAARKMAEQYRKAKEAQGPATLPDLILRANQDYGKTVSDLLHLLYGSETTVTVGMPKLQHDFKSDPKALWKQIKDLCMPEFTGPVIVEQASQSLGEELISNVLGHAEALNPEA